MGLHTAGDTYDGDEGEGEETPLAAHGECDGVGVWRRKTGEGVLWIGEGDWMVGLVRKCT